MKTTMLITIILVCWGAISLLLLNIDRKLKRIEIHVDEKK